MSEDLLWDIQSHSFQRKILFRASNTLEGINLNLLNINNCPFLCDKSVKALTSSIWWAFRLLWRRDECHHSFHVVLPPSEHGGELRVHHGPPVQVTFSSTPSLSSSLCPLHPRLFLLVLNHVPKSPLRSSSEPPAWQLHPQHSFDNLLSLTSLDLPRNI